MTRRSSLKHDQMRHALAQEAARLMAEQGIEDFLLAKRKAADRLGVNDTAVLPRNAEIEEALVAHQRLFRSHKHSAELSQLRLSALKLMRLLHEFQPRLVGSVLSGTASAHSEINIHVFTDQSEQVSLILTERGINHHHAQKKMRYEADRYVNYPSFKFVAGNHSAEVVTFPLGGIRQAPLSTVDGKPMQRATISEVEALIP